MSVRTLLAVSLVVVAGCATAPDAAPQRALGLANPASVYCGSLGGTVEIRRDAAGGEVGFCHLAHGSVMEEWALFRRDHPAP